MTIATAATIIAPPTPHTTPATIGTILGERVVDVIDDEDQSLVVVVTLVVIAGVGRVPEQCQHNEHTLKTAL
jgi:hypothetical protein